MIPANHAATRYAPNRGRSRTTRPATISMTATTYIVWCAVHGELRAITGARYLSQSTSTWKNLSSPNAIGATVNPIRSSQKAWATRSVRQLPTWRSGAAAVVVGERVLVIGDCLHL